MIQFKWFNYKHCALTYLTVGFFTDGFVFRLDQRRRREVARTWHFHYERIFDIPHLHIGWNCMEGQTDWSY